MRRNIKIIMTLAVIAMFVILLLNQEKADCGKEIYDFSMEFSEKLNPNMTLAQARNYAETDKEHVILLINGAILAYC